MVEVASGPGLVAVPVAHTGAAFLAQILEFLFCEPVGHPRVGLARHLGSEGNSALAGRVFELENGAAPHTVAVDPQADFGRLAFDGHRSVQSKLRIHSQILEALDGHILGVCRKTGFPGLEDLF